MNAVQKANFSQGFRAGHIDGKNRVGSYTLGEEFEASKGVAVGNSTGHPGSYDAWTAGYEAGYRTGACGDNLPAEHHLWTGTILPQDFQ